MFTVLRFVVLAFALLWSKLVPVHKDSELNPNFAAKNSGMVPPLWFIVAVDIIGYCSIVYFLGTWIEMGRVWTQDNYGKTLYFAVS